MSWDTTLKTDIIVNHQTVNDVYALHAYPTQTAIYIEVPQLEHIRMKICEVYCHKYISRPIAAPLRQALTISGIASTFSPPNSRAGQGSQAAVRGASSSTISSQMAQQAGGGKQRAALAVNNNITNMALLADEIQLAKTGVSLYDKALKMVQVCLSIHRHADAPQSHKDSKDVWTGLDEASMAWVKAMIQDPSIGPSAFYEEEECFADIIQAHLPSRNISHCSATAYELSHSETMALNISRSSSAKYLYHMTSLRIRKRPASITADTSSMEYGPHMMALIIRMALSSSHARSSSLRYPACEVTAKLV